MKLLAFLTNLNRYICRQNIEPPYSRLIIWQFFVTRQNSSNSRKIEGGKEGGGELPEIENDKAEISTKAQLIYMSIVLLEASCMDLNKLLYPVPLVYQTSILMVFRYNIDVKFKCRSLTCNRWCFSNTELGPFLRELSASCLHRHVVLD